MTRVTMCLCAAAMAWASPAAAFTRPKKEPDAKVRPCPEIGEDYVRLEGSDTCIRIGGLVRVEAVTQAGSR